MSQQHHAGGTSATIPNSTGSSSTSLVSSSPAASVVFMRPTGVPCRVSLDGVTMQATLIEVRRLYDEDSGGDVPAAKDGDPATTTTAALLFGYIRWKDTNNRRSQWVPASCILIATCSLDGSKGPSSSAGHAVYVANPVQPMLQAGYYQSTDGMRKARLDQANSNGSAALMAYFDERLRRDVQLPSPVRLYHYLQGRVAFAPWYFSPFDTIYSTAFDWRLDRLYDCHLCPFTLRCFSSAKDLKHFHQWLMTLSDVQDRLASTAQVPNPNSGSRTGSSAAHTVTRLHPPGGLEVYRDEAAGLSVFEMRGKDPRAVLYCQSLFLIGKSLLENKLAGHDVDVYVFYVVTLHAARHTPWLIDDSGGADGATGPRHASWSWLARRDPQIFAGYFSWEDGVEADNLACIAVLPCFASMGLGSFMIHVSYELAYRRGHVGSPERPLSDLGVQAYRSFWRDVVFGWLAFRCAAVLERDGGFDPFRLVTPAPHLQPVPPESLSAIESSLRETVFGGRYSRRRLDLQDLKFCIAFLRACQSELLQRVRPTTLSSNSAARRRWSSSSSLRAIVDVDAEQSSEEEEEDSNRSSSDNSDGVDGSSNASGGSEMGSDDDGDDANEAAADDSTAQALITAVKGKGRVDQTASGGRRRRQSFAIVKPQRDGELRLELLSVTIAMIARETKLEEADALDCLLWCGLLHRGSQDATLCIKVPIGLVCSTLERRVLQPSTIRFVPTLLKAHHHPLKVASSGRGGGGGIEATAGGGGMVTRKRDRER